MKFNQADSVINTFEASTFEFSAKPYLQHTSLFYQWATNASNSEIKLRISELKKLCNEHKSSNFSIKNEWHYFFLAEMYIQQSLLFAKSEMDWEAFKAFNQAKSYAQKSNQINNNFYPAYKSLGLIEVLEGAIPNQYSGIARLFGFKGNTLSGANKLITSFSKCALPNEKVYQAESAFILLYASANFSNLNVDIYKLAEILKPNNDEPMLKLGFIVYGKKNPSFRNLKETVFKSLTKSELKTLPYLCLLKCDWHLAQNNIDSAEVHLNQFKLINKLNGFDCRYLQRKIWIHYLKNEINQFQYYKNRLINTIPISEDDRQVLVEIKGISKIDAHLLKSRLLFDEGFLNQAQTELKLADSVQTIWNKKEYNYRIGRIAHSKGDLQRAIIYYDKLNSLSNKDDHDYFGAYALFYSAELMIQKKQYKAAQTKLNKALTFTSHAYQKSFSAKINRLLKEIKTDNQTKK